MSENKLQENINRPKSIIAEQKPLK